MSLGRGAIKLQPRDRRRVGWRCRRGDRRLRAGCLDGIAGPAGPFASCASKPRLKSSSITNRAPASPAEMRDLRLFLASPPAIALITQNPRQRRPSILEHDRYSALPDRLDECAIVARFWSAYSTANSRIAPRRSYWSPCSPRSSRDRARACANASRRACRTSKSNSRPNFTQSN